MRYRWSTAMAGLVAGVITIAGLSPWVARAEEPPGRPPSKQTPVISRAVFKTMEAAQKQFESGDLDAALATLDRLRQRRDRLSAYEHATLLGIYASVYYEAGRTDDAIEAYRESLTIEGISPELRANNLYAMAQMLIADERFEAGIKALKRWFGLAPEIQPDAYILLAQAYYQTQAYDKAESPILHALRLAREKGRQPKENWLSLLRSVYYEQEQFERAAKALQVLVAMYPKESYFVQLSGMYGLLGRQADQLATLRAAYEAGLLTGESDLVNLARLYMAEQSPFPATEVLANGMESGRIEKTADNLQLLAQAQALARNYEAQIPVLEELTRLTGKAKHYNYLGQAHMELGHYGKAAEAFRAALDSASGEARGEAWMLLGNALYNQEKPEQALKAFRRAVGFEKKADDAENWIKFLESEIKRQDALAASNS